MRNFKKLPAAVALQPSAEFAGWSIPAGAITILPDSVAYSQHPVMVASDGAPYVAVPGGGYGALRAAGRP